MPLLPRTIIDRLHRAAIELNLARDALVAGMNVHFAASLPRAPSPTAQHLMDLHRLNDTGPLTDGSLPLRVWLEEAISMTEMRPEGGVFKEAFALLPPSPAGNRHPPRSTPPSARESGGDGPLLYVSFAQKDAPIVERIETHLAGWQRGSGARLWHPGKAAPGADLQAEIEARLARAEVFLLIVSADLLASDQADQEVRAAMVSHYLKRAQVVPILARPCDFSGAPFAHLRMLPYDKRAISQNPRADDAYTEISRVLRSMVADVKRGRDSTPPPRAASGEGRYAYPADASSPSSSREPAAKPGVAIGDVFCTSGTPEVTYVEPVQMARLRAALAIMGKGLIVEGPSQIGKSTAIRRALGDAPMRWIACAEHDGASGIKEVLAARPIKGHVIVDDVQKLSAEQQATVCALARELADRGDRGGKITLVGAPGITQRLLGADHHLRARFTLLTMDRQPEEKLLALVDQGEAAANVRFVHRAEIARQASGSFRLAQELCQQLIIKSGLQNAPAHREPIGNHPDEVREEVLRSLGFEGPLVDFARADHDTGGRGAALAALWMLSRSPDLKVTLFRVKQRFPILEAGVDALESEILPRLLAPGEGALGEMLSLEYGELSALDPRLGYHLASVPWQRFGERAQVDVRWDAAGEPVFAAPAVEANEDAANGDAEPRGARWLRDSTYPMYLREARAARDILVTAYPSLVAARNLASQVPIDLELWDDTHGYGPAWDSLLKLAAAQGKTRELMLKVLHDRHASGCHEALRRVCGLDL